MQTCSKCHSISSDTVIICPTCQSDLRESSTSAVALKSFKSNPRVIAVRLIVANGCCPVCQQAEGVYPVEKTPTLPLEGCSDVDGCKCFYMPVLDEIYP